VAQSVCNDQPFIWSGISLKIPAEWETGALGNGYALLEYRFNPILELKTAKIRGRFSFRRHLNQLARSGAAGAAPRLERIAPPPAWPAFPSAVQIEAFAWRGVRMAGEGLLHFCRTCRRATLIQFYGQGLAEAPRVLASLRDHDAPPAPTFAVYDVQATLPERFSLAHFQFEAGRFTLVFSHARESVTLWRWSPADVILARHGGDLAGFLQEQQLLPAAARDAAMPAGQGLQWQWRCKLPGRGLKGLLRPRSRDTLCVLRIWHQPENNRLAAVRAEALADHTTFDRICRSYGIIPKAKAAHVAG
jgi:hypothetical protein